MRVTNKLALAAPLALATLLTACGDSNDATPPPVSLPGPTPAPAPGPTPAPPTTFDVTACIEQTVPGTTTTVAGAIIPDTLTIDFAQPSGFPNGRRLQDQVVDVTLALIFLDLTEHAPTTLAGVPVNPPANDVPFPTNFPYLAPPQGNPPISGSAGRNFTFTNAADSLFQRVDRVGMPAVATVLIPDPRALAYNDADPADDVDGEFVPEITEQLTGLTNALADDLTGLGLTPCATPTG